jgi:glucose/sorbosone dehydrogenase
MSKRGLIVRLVNNCLCVLACMTCAFPGTPDLTIEIKDYTPMPITGAVDGAGNSAGLLARINFMREEPGRSRKRFFVNDLNGPLYILDKDTRKLTTYLDFNGLEGHSGIFHRLTIDNLLASGFISFQFDPDYARNGKFYTIHLEDPALPASNFPDSKNFPGFKTVGYSVTPAIRTFGQTQREAVLIEWTDSDISNTTFEGTAREVMRLEYNGRIHPMGDLIFNPTARPGDSEWCAMYISTGDGGSGEQRSNIRSNPQRLDTLVGKILRIIPDLKEHVDASTVSENGRYRIPKDNPFASKPGARKEIWAYGLRNPHRLTWDVDPDGPGNHLIANVIGLHTWETVDIIHKGANYGYSLREGPQQLNPDNTLSKPPDVDKIPVQINESTTDGMISPTYPVIAYGHVSGVGGDAISNGFVYRGKAIPALRGKFLLCDITTGRIWWADFKEMLAVDDGDPKTMAEIHEVKIAAGKEIYGTMAPITEAAYHARGGKAEHLPGAGRVPGGRSDIRFAMDSDGELYILSKSDGVIRAVVGAVEH